jgi:hypothetical protein
MNSKTLPIYAGWLQNQKQELIRFVDAVYLLAEQNMNRGGKHIVNSMIPSEIVEKFNSIEQVQNSFIVQ